ncbi:MAG: hypothetical protein HKN47_17665 [Pirellulaceae bacterium]|nr:hypothetical protein [Pirellulaceae bacterium]
MSNDSFHFDTSQNAKPISIVEGIRLAKQSGKGMGAMVREITKLRFGLGRLRPDEYFMYGLYDDNRYTPEAKLSFLSQDQNLLVSPWATFAKDKPLLTATLTGLGLPTPETQAIVHASRTFAGAAALRNREDVCRFLRQEARYPIFGKPFDSACSMGTAKINGYDRENDAVLIGGDQLIPIDGFADMIESLGQDYLFQTLMLPHDEIAKLIGPSVSSVRMFVISDEDGCSLFRAAWKIPSNANSADNFWRVGNMLAGIDVETGRIVKTLVRTETGSTVPIDAHPVTGADFNDMVFPMWDQMRSTVLAAAVNLPNCHFQGWDVALTDRGPVLVELEGDGGNPIMEQLCFESGLLTERYKRVVQWAQKKKDNEQSQLRAQNRSQMKNSLAALVITPQTNAKKGDAETVENSADSANHVSAAVTAPVSPLATPESSSVNS